MRPQDVYELVNVADPRLSPDGSRVAYSVVGVDGEANEYRSAIWIANADGSGEPVRFTSGDKRDGGARWSPDGHSIAFTSNRGDEKAPSAIYVIPAEGGEARKLTDLKESVESIAWSPDSSRIAFTARVRDDAYEEEDDRKRAPRRFKRVFHKLDSVGWTGDRRKHVFVVDVHGDSPEPKQLTHGDFEHDGPAWSPDGKTLAFGGLRDERWDVELINRIYVVDVDADGDGEPRALTGDGASFESPSWSPDGSRIAFHWSLEDGTWPHHTQIGVMDADGGNVRVLTQSLDRQCAPYPDSREPVWDGDDLLFTVEERGNIHLYAVASDGSAAPRQVLGGEQVLAGFDKQNGTLVYTAGTHTTMRELFNEQQQLTNVGKDFVAGRELIEPERFTAVSKDGYEVDAWVVRPPDFDPTKRYPTILTIHGGPFTQYGTSFFDEFQVMASGGYVVLFSNPRGGSGYSEEHGRAIRGPLGDAGPGWGSRDYEDLMAVVDTALERFDFVDGDRLGVIGGSYGGYMTSWIIGHTNRFKAAISERAVNNLVSMFGSSDLFWVFERQFGGALWDGVDAYLEKSPSTYAQQIETPVLIMHSEQDLRCNIEQGEHLFTLLRLMGKETEMLRFPAESHELTRGGAPQHRVTRFEAVLEWFDRYL